MKKALRIRCKQFCAKRSIFYVSLYLLYFFLSACNPTKKLAENELLLKKNVVINKSGTINRNEIKPYIKQRPNTKVIFWRSYLSIYNSVNQEKMEKKKIKINERKKLINEARIKKNNLRNEKRLAQGKKPKKAVLKKIDRRTRRELILSIGEPPVIYDSALTEKSVDQVKLFLYNKGFFNATVRDSSSVKHKKITKYYIVQENTPYTLRTINYEIKDEQLKYYVLSDTSSSLLNQGENYDVDVFQKERERITNVLRNNGYFQFSKEYIYFEIDSALGTYQVNATLGIKNFLEKVEGIKDSVLEVPHPRYYLQAIYVHTDYDPKLETVPGDTLTVDDYQLIYRGDLRYKPRLITDAVFLSKGELFQQNHVDQTYRRFVDLKLFRSVQIQFVPITNSQLDCHIYLSNIPKQSFSVETELTNASGTLGMAGNLVYQNKNSFRGGEIVEVKFKGALEVQKVKSKNENLIVTGIESPIPFNTLELGSEINLFIPRFVTPFNIRASKNNNAKTNLTANFNFQRRPDYRRTISNLAYGYIWKETITKRHIINPIEFNLVKIFGLSTQLQNTINEPDVDLFLKNSYSDHFTLGSRYAFIFSNQDINRNRNFSFLRVGAEAAGNLMRWVFNLADQFIAPIKYVDGSYLVEHIRFAQFLRFDMDYRYYKMLNISDKLVSRFAFGIGKPLHNLRTLPLEKSFFGGGPNGIRAWETRTLGPGAHVDAVSNYADKIGDIKIEGNFEYRFNVIKMLKSALFVDAGNIWLRKPYEKYPGGEFTAVKFLGEIAIGAGMGFRLDFNFFILRLDVAFKVKDPALPQGDRWTLGKQPLKHPAFNFGIGYPF